MSKSRQNMRSFSVNQSMEGTYKYKQTFVSKQRNDYVDGNLSFEDIDDYLIDADVNSLYPQLLCFQLAFQLV